MELSHSLTGWKRWVTDLLNFKRYHKINVMHYRTDLWIHGHRVREIAMDMVPFAEKAGIKIDKRKIAILAPHHDDYEAYSKRGDIPLPLKLLADPEELRAIRQDEYEAIEKLLYLYPKNIGKYSYRKLLYESIRKDTPEAQLVSFADKHDGFFEAMHEVFAGNLSFLEPMLNYERHTFSLNKLEERFPLIADLFKDEKCPYNNHYDFVARLPEFFDKGINGRNFHTKESLKMAYGPSSYKRIIGITLNKFASGLEILTKVKEDYVTPKALAFLNK